MSSTMNKFFPLGVNGTMDPNVDGTEDEIPADMSGTKDNNLRDMSYTIIDIPRDIGIEVDGIEVDGIEVDDIDNYIGDNNLADEVQVDFLQADFDYAEDEVYFDLAENEKNMTFV